MSEDPGPAPSARSQRFLRAILPIGVALLVIWIIWLFVMIAIGGSGFSIVSAILGLLTSLTLIISGRYYRAALRRQ